MRVQKRGRAGGPTTSSVNRTTAAGLEMTDMRGTTADVTGRGKRRLLSWAVFAVLFLAVAISFCIRQAEVMAAQKRLSDLEKEIQYYQAMNEALVEQVETLKSSEYIEKTAREKLGLVRPGEVQYMLVINETDTTE